MEGELSQSNVPFVDIGALNELDVCNLKCFNVKDCNKLHICAQFLFSGRCQYGSDQDGSCRFGHDIKSGHNQTVLERTGLHGVTLKDLRSGLISLKKNVGIVPICELYQNEQNHENDHCPALHICFKYLFTSCSGQCNLSHDLQALNCPVVLEYYGITLTEENVKGTLEHFKSQRRRQSDTSRFYRDYKNRMKIGSGTFGRVYKVEHVIDKQKYAVKCIPFNSKDIESVVKEAQIIARLQHQNVVQYHTCWIEPGIPNDEKKQNSSHSDRQSSKGHKETGANGKEFKVTKKICHNNETVDTALSTMAVQRTYERITPLQVTEMGCRRRHFEQDKRAIDKISQLHFATPEDSSCQTHKEQECCFGTDERANEPDDDTERDTRHLMQARTLSLSRSTLVQSLPPDQSLYFAMELCEMDLSAILLKKEKYTKKQMDAIYIDTLRAVEFLHSKHIVHRDIKLENIYFRNGMIKIGDFGNACAIDDKDEFSLQQALDVQALGKLGIELFLQPKPGSCVTDICKAIINGCHKKVKAGVQVFCNGQKYVFEKWRFDIFKDMLTTDGNTRRISAEQAQISFLANMNEQD